jgi:hypothetical protein
VIGPRKDRHGRWRIEIRWYASPSIGGRESWYSYRADAVRRPDGLSGRPMLASTDGAKWTVETVDLYRTG